MRQAARRSAVGEQPEAICSTMGRGSAVGASMMIVAAGQRAPQLAGTCVGLEHTNLSKAVVYFHLVLRQVGLSWPIACTCNCSERSKQNSFSLNKSKRLVLGNVP